MTAKIIPPLVDNDDYSTWTTNLVTALMLLSLVLPMLFMLCMSVGMGRTWSLFFMVQLLSNYDNFGKVKFPANVQYFMRVLYDISNFNLNAIEDLKRFMKAEWLFG